MNWSQRLGRHEAEVIDQKSDNGYDAEYGEQGPPLLRSFPFISPAGHAAKIKR